MNGSALSRSSAADATRRTTSRWPRKLRAAPRGRSRRPAWWPTKERRTSWRSSHELRTPLNAILGYGQLLLTGTSGPLNQVQTGHLRRVDANAGHLLQMIEQILSYAELEGGLGMAEPREFQLSELMGEVAAVAEPLLHERGLSFRVVVTDPQVFLFSDAHKVRQITLHLLSNAMKFTEVGRVQLTAEVHNDDLIVTVNDTGRGIAPESIGTMFEAFRAADPVLTRRAGGAGLGLSVSQRLAQMLGGRLSVPSELGVGSTFTLRVPARMPVRS